MASARSAGGPATYLQTREDRVVIDRDESQALELRDSVVELLADKRAGWSDDGEAAARFEGARLQHHRNRAISSAMARCSSRPSRCRSACALERPGRDGGGQEALLGALLALAARRRRAPTAARRFRQRKSAPRARPPAWRGRRCRSGCRRIPPQWRERPPRAPRRCWRSPSFRDRRSGSRPRSSARRAAGRTRCGATASPDASRRAPA